MSRVGLNIGLQALLSSQTALETIGHNVSNANTPGYSRQRVHLLAERPLLLRGLEVGGGVKAESIQRTVDDLITRRIVAQVANVGRLDSLLLGMEGVEALLGEPDSNGLGMLVDDLFASFSELSTDTADPAFRAGVVQTTHALTDHFHHLAREAALLRDDAADRVRAVARDINDKAAQIQQLNEEIRLAESSGVMANDQRDRRDMLLRELGEQIDVTYHEDERGAVRVLVEGQLLVGPHTVHPLSVAVDPDGAVTLTLEESTRPVEPRSGAIAGLIAFSRDFVPGFRAGLDRLARNLVLELNRAHSTGIPASGGFQHLTGAYRLTDVDGDGALTDERVADAGLPFDVQDGDLLVHVRDTASGVIRTHTIAIDAARTTVGDLLQAFNDVPELSAELDSLGRFQIHADGGHTFDFGRRLSRAPDAYAGSFGGGRASHGTALEGPFDLTAGSTLDLTGPTSSFTITFDPASFDDMSQASAAEVAAVINASPDSAANLMRAVAVGDQVFLQSQDEGAGQSFSIDGGTALAALGFTAATVVTGHAASALVEVHGEYEGAANQRWTFRPDMDGQIGSTPGLRVVVEDENGLPVATLDVGAGYVPGTPLPVADGLSVSFTVGELSASDNDAFGLDLIVDSDQADVLVALGLNGYLVGTDAESITLAPDIAADPARMATGYGGGSGDNGALLEILDLQHRSLDGLDGSFAEFYGSIVGGVGFDIESTTGAMEVEQFLTDSLETRRQQVSGVNVDEELVDMIQYEQAFASASRYIQVINGLMDEVLQLL